MLFRCPTFRKCAVTHCLHDTVVVKDMCCLYDVVAVKDTHCLYDMVVMKEMYMADNMFYFQEICSVHEMTIKEYAVQMGWWE